MLCVVTGMVDRVSRIRVHVAEAELRIDKVDVCIGLRLQLALNRGGRQHVYGVISRFRPGKRSRRSQTPIGELRRQLARSS